MEYLTLKGIISVQKTLSGELSQDVLVLVGKSIAEEVIEARDGNECLLDKLNTFVEKIEGKQLTTNDYTNTDKSKVDNLPLNTNSELNKKADNDNVYTKSEVDSKLLNKADKSDSLSGYGITDAYTKSEIDNKISNVYEIKGSSTIANLPTNPEVGDVYNITDSGTITGTEIEVSVGDNIVYTSDGWDKLSATVDLSGYQEKLTFDDTPTADSTNPVISGGVKTALDGKADKTELETVEQTANYARDTANTVANKVFSTTDGLDTKADKADLTGYLKITDINSAVRSVRPDVKNAIDTIVVNTIYDLGVQTELNITLPSGQIGNFIEFDFISGDTATTLTVNSSSGLVGFDLIPGTNTVYTLYFDWGVIGHDGTYSTYGWRFNYSEYSNDV